MKVCDSGLLQLISVVPFSRDLLTYLFAYLHRAVSVGHWLAEDHVSSYADKTLRVRWADVSLTRDVIQTSVLGVDDLDDILFMAADRQNGVLTRRGTQSWRQNNSTQTNSHNACDEHMWLRGIRADNVVLMGFPGNGNV